MDGLKQRIIGALVLICLAIIFVPMLFDEPHNQQTTKTIEIPNKPSYPVMTIEQPKKPAAAAAGETSGPIAQEGGQVSGAAPTAPAGSSPVTNTASVQGSATAPATPTTEQSSAATNAPSTTAQSSESAQQAATASSVPSQTAAPEAAPSQAASGQTAPAQKATAKPEEKPSFSQTLKGAWTVQLGSFGDTKNAQRLRDSVRAKGYPAYLQTAHAGGKTLTRVFSGPFVKKTDAEAAKSKLDKAFHIKSLVVAGDK